MVPRERAWKSLHYHLLIVVVTLLLGLTMHSPWSISAKSLSASLNEMFLNAGCTITRFTYSEKQDWNSRTELTSSKSRGN